jgi:hypothetical protein
VIKVTNQNYHLYYLMLQVNKGVSNKVVTTVYEKQTLTAPYYLWRFISEGLNTEVAFVLAYDSQSPRCEVWTIIEGTTATIPSGISEYRIYEQTSASNTDYNNATNTTPLEIGLCYVHGTATDTYSQPTYSDSFSTPQ